MLSTIGMDDPKTGKEAIVLCPECGIVMSRKGFGRHWRAHRGSQRAQTPTLTNDMIARAQPYLPPYTFRLPYEVGDASIPASESTSHIPACR